MPNDPGEHGAFTPKDYDPSLVKVLEAADEYARRYNETDKAWKDETRQVSARLRDEARHKLARAIRRYAGVDEAETRA